MRKGWMKALCLLLAVTLCFGLVPFSVVADDAGFARFTRTNTFSDTTFSDVASSNWFYDNVKAVYELGLMIGRDDGTFGVTENVTVAETAAVAARLYSIYTGDGHTFVQGEPWYQVYIDYLTERNLVSFNDLTPSAPATRAQYAGILGKVFPEEGLAAINLIADNSIPDVAAVDPYSESIYRLYRAGVLTGNDDKGTFTPNNPISRSEVAAIVARIADPSLRKSAKLGDVVTVTFQMNYGSAGAYQVISVSKGSAVSNPGSPSRTGYGFDGWYTASVGGTRYNFSNPVVTDLTVYAHWSEIGNSGLIGGIGGSAGGSHGSAGSVSGAGIRVVLDGNGGHFYSGYNQVSSISVSATFLGRMNPDRLDTPVRSGYRFTGWYRDEEAEHEYNFNSIILASFRLYAGWVVDSSMSEVSDDYSATESETVTANDRYYLNSSVQEAPVDQTTEIIFNVNSTLTISNGFQLYCNGTDTGVTLYDDGQYELHRDDIPFDGCYTGSYSFTPTEEGNYSFTAKAIVGYSEIETESIVIFAFEAMTDEEYQAMEDLENGAVDLLRNAREANAETDAETLIAAIRESLDTYFEEAVEAGTIENLVYNPEGYAYTWTYSDTGIETTLFIYESETTEEIKSGRRDDSGILSDEGDEEETDYPGLNPNYMQGIRYSKGNVVILNTYNMSHPWSRGYSAFAETMRNAGFRVDEIFSMECRDFMNLQEYNSLIMVDSHGNTINGQPDGIPMICTEEEQTKEKTTGLYYSDILNGRIRKVTLTTGERVYWIAPSFFTFHYLNNPLNAPIVYLGCCRAYPEPDYNVRLVDAFVTAGASAACGYSASVSVSYDDLMATELVKSFLAGRTVSESIAAAKAAVSIHDTYRDEQWDRHAVLNFYGDRNAMLYHTLLNGNFDHPLSQNMRHFIYGWEKYGDVQSIHMLNRLTPPSSPKMVIVTTGIGSNDSSTASCIYQTFLVPEDASRIEFTYDVISEEPMEYVGSKFNDKFQADLLTTDGELLTTLVFESVNSSDWIYVEGVPFPGGDETTYHTRWASFVSDQIAQYRNQLVVLRFTVQDTGDTIFDTAVLIDSVSVS